MTKPLLRYIFKIGAASALITAFGCGGGSLGGDGEEQQSGIVVTGSSCVQIVSVRSGQEQCIDQAEADACEECLCNAGDGISDLTCLEINLCDQIFFERLDECI